MSPGGVGRADRVPRYLAVKVGAALISFVDHAGHRVRAVQPDAGRPGAHADPRPSGQRGAAGVRCAQELGVGQPFWERFLTLRRHTRAPAAGLLLAVLSSRWPRSSASASARRCCSSARPPSSRSCSGSGSASAAAGGAGSLFDRISSGVSLTLWSVPTFWLGLILLVVFSVGLGPDPRDLPGGRHVDSRADGQLVRRTRRHRAAPRAARGHARAGRLRAVRDHHAVVDHRRARQSVSAHRPREGSA